MRPIVVPLDGSTFAARAVIYAQELARRSGATIHLVRVAHGRAAPGTDATEAQVAAVREAESAIAAHAARLRLDRVEAVEHVVYGNVPAIAIADLARDLDAGAVVMSTHGRSGLGRLLYGSVAEGVIRHSTTPVLLVPATCRRPWRAGPGGKVVVPLDGSAPSEAGIAPAAELAVALGAEVALVRVVEDPYQAAVDTLVTVEPFDARAQVGKAEDYLDVHARQLQEDGVVATVQAPVGHPPMVIAELAAEPATLAVAMATHGRGGVMRFLLGSVAAAVVHGSPVPILLVRPRARAAGELRAATFACHQCGAPYEAVASDLPVEARCGSCHAHLHVCGNCVYERQGDCLLGLPAGAELPGLRCGSFSNRVRINR